MPENVPLKPAPPQRPGPSVRVQAYRAALASPLLLLSPVPTLAPSARADTAANTSLATEEQQLLSLGDSVLRAAARSGGNGNGNGDGGGGGTGGASSLASGADARHGAFLHAAQEIHGERGPAAGARLAPLRSPYTLRAGTLIPG